MHEDFNVRPRRDSVFILVTSLSKQEGSGSLAHKGGQPIVLGVRENKRLKRREKSVEHKRNEENLPNPKREFFAIPDIGENVPIPPRIVDT